MTTKNLTHLLALCVLLLCGTALSAQDEMAADAAVGANYTPDHGAEFGISLGHNFIQGDFQASPNFGVGLHFRKAFDYIFSLRIDGMYLNAGGEDNQRPKGINDIEDYQSRILGLDGQLVISLNSMLFNKPSSERKFNPYVFAGAGIADVVAEAFTQDGRTLKPLEIQDASINTYATGGAGISLKVGPKFNIGLEHKVILPFGRAGDLLDGWDNANAPQLGTTFRDVDHYTNVRLNFNLGQGKGKSEPLYWVNPLEGVIADISELKARPVFDLTDTDGDGVIDMIDADVNSPAGAIVDTRGNVLDSDGDGIPDYQDTEPYSPPGYSVDSKGVAQIPDAGYVTEADVNRLIDGKLAGFRGGSGIADWFLPMIHFNLDSYSIRDVEYGKMANIAYVLKKNPGAQVVVKGFTDKSASDDYNRVLSYNRAKSAIDFLTQVHGIDPSRLVLQYGGEDNTLVPTDGTSLMNRRVEFMVSDGSEQSMGRPDGPNAGKGRFGGVRNAGY